MLNFRMIILIHSKNSSTERPRTHRLGGVRDALKKKANTPIEVGMFVKITGFAIYIGQGLS